MSTFDDPINHPPHYTFGEIECIDVIEDWNLGYHLGNALKYICRAERKGNKIEDLEKAVWYIQRYIDNSEECIGRSLPVHYHTDHYGRKPLDEKKCLDSASIINPGPEDNE